jgi:hypothetical protein
MSCPFTPGYQPAEHCWDVAGFWIVVPNDQQIGGSDTNSSNEDVSLSISQCSIVRFHGSLHLYLQSEFWAFCFPSSTFSFGHLISLWTSVHWTRKVWLCRLILSDADICNCSSQGRLNSRLPCVYPFIHATETLAPKSARYVCHSGAHPFTIDLNLTESSSLTNWADVCLFVGTIDQHLSTKFL